MPRHPLWRQARLEVEVAARSALVLEPRARETGELGLACQVPVADRNLSAASMRERTCSLW